MLKLVVVEALSALEPKVAVGTKLLLPFRTSGAELIAAGAAGAALVTILVLEYLLTVVAKVSAVLEGRHARDHVKVIVLQVQVQHCWRVGLVENGTVVITL